MSLTNTPASERVHIAFFGRRNAGKSSLVNAVTGQEMSVVSDTLGTTTDPVSKTMEILPLGPVIIIDTPGFDDEGALGQKRVAKTEEVVRRADIAVLVTDAAGSLQADEIQLMETFAKANVPFLLVCNRMDLTDEADRIRWGQNLKKLEQTDTLKGKLPEELYFTCAIRGEGIHELKEALGRLAPTRTSNQPLLSDLVGQGEFVVLVTPIDESAPKGRMILPEQMAIRDALDHLAIPIVTQVDTYPKVIETLGKDKIRLVVTDSQAFKEVAALTPQDLKLTSFSILMARYKGILSMAVDGARRLSQLEDGDMVLISEGCTHHRQCGDIGTVKLPKLLKKFTGKELKTEFTSGRTFPPAGELKKYKLVIHCGGCMLTDRDVATRYAMAAEENVPMTNYGIAIACMRGILDRSIEML